MTTITNKGYPLPDTIDPGSNICIKVYVPDDPLYVAAFWAAYKYLATWVAWERTGDTSGAQAAAVWTDAFNLARSEYVAGHPCDWLAEPQYTEGEGEDELADFLWAVKVILQEMVDELDDSKTYVFFKAWYLETFGVWPGQVWEETWDYLSGLTPTQRQDAVDGIPWEDVYSTAYCHAVSICGEGGYLERFYCWAEAIIDGIVDAAQEIEQDILTNASEAIEALKDLLGSGVITPLSFAFHEYGGNFEFEEVVCTWTHVFDFSLGTLDWVVWETDGYDCGTHDGTKWVGNPCYDPATGQHVWRRNISIKIDFPEALTITNIHPYCSWLRDYTENPNAEAFRTWGRLEGSSELLYYRTFNQLTSDKGNGDFDYDLDTNKSLDELLVNLTCSRGPDEEDADGGYAHILSVEVSGVGYSDPFV
jgi:hypothetical protein